jgi:hypothetical protein
MHPVSDSPTKIEAGRLVRTGPKGTDQLKKTLAFRVFLCRLFSFSVVKLRY